MCLGLIKSARSNLVMLYISLTLLVIIIRNHYWIFLLLIHSDISDKTSLSHSDIFFTLPLLLKILDVCVCVFVFPFELGTKISVA